MSGSTRHDISVDPDKLAAGDPGRLYRGCINWSLKNEALGRRPAYVYYFTRQLPGDNQGAFHSSELWYMFGTLDRSWRPWEPCDHRLSDRMLIIGILSKQGIRTAIGCRPGHPAGRPNPTYRF